MIKKEHFKLIIVMTIFGILLSIIERIYIFFIVRGTNEWTESMTNITTIINSTISIVFIIIIGLFVARKMERKKLSIAISIVIVYSIIALIIQQVMQSLGLFSMILIWMFAPIRIFSFLVQWIMMIDGISVYFGIAISYFAPFVFMLFTVKKKYVDE